MRYLPKIILITFAFCVLTACNKNEEIVSREPVTIHFSWWGNDDRHDYTIDAINEFEEANENIQVKSKYGEWNGYSKRVEVAMASHTEEDLMQINYNWLYKYSADGEGYYDLSELADYINFDNYDHDVLAYGEVNGKLNGIPTALNAMVFYQNASLYEEYALTVPTTWADYFAAARVMEKDGIYPLGMVQKQMFLLLVSRYEQETGKEFINQSGELLATKEEIQDMLTFHKRLVDEHVIMPVDEFEREIFSQEKVAGTIAWVSDGTNYCDNLINAGKKIIVGDYPMLDKAKRFGWYIKPATMYAIRKDTQHIEETAKLLNYLISDEEAAKKQGLEKGIPLNKSAYKALEEEDVLSGIQYEADAKMKEHKRDMHLMSPYMEETEIINIYKKYATDYQYEQISEEEAAELIYSEINSQLEKLKSN